MQARRTSTSVDDDPLRINSLARPLSLSRERIALTALILTCESLSDNALSENIVAILVSTLASFGSVLAAALLTLASSSLSAHDTRSQPL